MSEEENAREKKFKYGELVFFPTSQLVTIPVDGSMEKSELKITIGRAKSAKDFVEVDTAVVAQGSEVLLYQNSTAQLVITRYTD
jgi:hypothetical protein